MASPPESLSAPEKESQWLAALREQLQRKTYRAAPVRRVEIPKAGGGVRRLGIPTVQDRVVQMAVYLVLLPVFEADFHPCSYGYRPKRGAHEAVEAIRQAQYRGLTEVVDADLAQYFDTIPHRPLMRLVARRVSDGAILKLIKAWLRAPIEEEGPNGGKRLKANPCGTPQGGVICQRPPALPCGLPAAGYLAPLGSPLLANLYLNPLDHAVADGCREQAQMVRYADDLVILCQRGQGLKLKKRLARWLAARGLRLNESKTRVVDNRKGGFTFLGFSFRWQRSRAGQPYVHIEPSPAAEQALRDKVRALTRCHTTGQAPQQVVRKVNEVLRGWGQYFGVHHGRRSLHQMSHYAANRLRQWLWRKHGNPHGRYLRWPDHVLFREYGLHRCA